MSDSAQSPLFRAPKRRKVFRARDTADDDNESITPAAVSRDDEPDQQHDQEHPKEDVDNAVQELLRQRRLGKARPRGIGFAQEQSSRRTRTTENEDNVLEIATTETPSALASAATRFAAETGQRVVTDDSAM